MENAAGLAIFDLDGTLVDSVQQIGKVLNATRFKFGFSELAQDFYELNVGLPLNILISDMALDEEAERIFTRSFRSSLMDEIKTERNHLFPGVRDVLELLRISNIKLAIATSKPTEIADLVYKNSDLSQFEILVQGTDDFAPKPSPEVINRVLTKNRGLRALMVGDRIEDIEAAISARIPSIGVAASGHSQAELSNSGAKYVFGNMLEFHHVLANNILTIENIFQSS